MPGFEISKHSLSVFKVHMSSLVSISAHIVSKQPIGEDILNGIFPKLKIVSKFTAAFR